MSTEAGVVIATKSTPERGIYAGQAYVLGLDVEKVLQGDLVTQQDPTKDDATIAVQFMFNELQTMFGAQVLDNTGALAHKMSVIVSRAARILGVTADTEDQNGLRRLFAAALVGKSGANTTWNSAHLLGVLITAMLDDRIVNTASHYTNIEGIPSVVRNLERGGVFRDTVFHAHNEIEKINSKLNMEKT